MERSLQVATTLLQHVNPKIGFFFQKNLKLNFDLYFDLCWRDEIIQVGLDINLYDIIGDASSSLRGSTSSAIIYIFNNLLILKYLLFSEACEI